MSEQPGWATYLAVAILTVETYRLNRSLEHKKVISYEEAFFRVTRSIGNRLIEHRIRTGSWE